MDGLTKEVSPAPSKSTKGLKSVLNKARLARRDDPSTASTTSFNGTEEGSERGGGIRNSVDSLLDRARESRGNSIDDGLPSGPSNLSKLVPGRVKKKRRKRAEAEQLQQELAEERGRSIDDQTATSAQRKGEAPGKSRNGLEGDEEEGEEEADSLMTVDSDSEAAPVAPPPLVSHQSHVPYLTTSSPLIKTHITSETPNDPHLDSPTFQNPQYHRTGTLPTTHSTTSSSTNLAPRHASTADPIKSDLSLGTPDGSRSRGVSPGARIKDVFAVGSSRKKSTSPPKSPDRASARSSGNGKPLGGLFGTGDRRKTVNIGSGSQESDAFFKSSTDRGSASNSNRDLPAIKTTPRPPTSDSLETPATTVTPPTPTEQRMDPPESPSVKNRGPSSAGTNANTIISPSGNMISHRRARSDSATHAPSKLSNAMSAPLTPMAEESRQLGARSPGSQGSPGGSGGFFSSVFSAAQNAANQLSSTIANNNSQPLPRSSAQTAGEDGALDNQAPTADVSDVEDAPVDEKKRLAVETLGNGELSLSHLGIGDSPSPNDTSPVVYSNGTAARPNDGVLVQREEAAARAEDVSAARAVSAAYSEKPSDNNVATPTVEDIAPAIRPRSTYESSIVTGDRTPPNGSIDGDTVLRRSGSVRSRVETIARRKRNSSSVTGGTIGAAIAAGNAAVINPSASGSTARLTGFAVASKKRNRDFHQLFRSVPEDDYLIEDYSCALQRDIILAGRIYVSEGHICFSSNILGWVTTLIISFDEIVSVEKESTAVVFPNAIAIQTLHARHTFRSLLSREATYDLLIGIWKISHPTLKSSLNGSRLENGGTGDKTEKIDPGSDEASDITEEEEIYDEDEEDDEGAGSFTEIAEGSVAGDENIGDSASKSAARKASAMGVAAGAAAGGVPTTNDAKAGEKAAAVASTASVDFPGPATHAPTECGDADSHYDKPLKDDIIPAPLGKVYSMMFGPASGGFMAKWLLDEMKVTDLQMEDDKKGLNDEIRTKSYSYIKPLYASIGPKSTKCIINDTLESIDLEKAVSITSSTQTPDVPSGNVFATKTHFCMMWAPGNATRLVINFTIEWTGKSWLKGPIEKGANDGQITYANDLVKALKAGVTSRSRSGTIGSKLKGKGKRRKGEVDTAKRQPSTEKPSTSAAPQQANSWGFLQPLHDIVSPVADIFSPMISSNTIIGFLIFIILLNWFRSSSSAVPATRLSFAGMPPSERIAAYEEIWRREESDLWDWLEERVKMQGVAYPDSDDDRDSVVKARRQREQSLKSKGMMSKLADVKMSEREIDRAILVTEERLGTLKRAVQEKKSAHADADLSREEGGGEPPPSPPPPIV